MPRSRLWARFLLSGKSGTDAPRHEAAGSDLSPSRPGFPVRLTGRDIPRGLLLLARDSPHHPGRGGQGIVCGRSRAVGPGLRLGTSTAPDRFPPGPSAQRP